MRHSCSGIRASFISALLFVLSFSFHTSVAAQGKNLLDTIPPGQWIEIPGSKLRPAIYDGPLASQIHASNGPESLMTAWSGAAYDTKRNNLVVWGGGHTDYSGNELYAFNTDSLSWTRLTDPSHIGGYDDNGIYPDGKPASRHTYGSLAYIPKTDRFFGTGGAVYHSTRGDPRAWLFNFDTGEWTQSATPPYRYVGDQMAYDPGAGRIWLQSIGIISSYDPVTNAWTAHGNQNFQWQVNIYSTGAIDPNNRLFVSVGGGLTAYWDLDATVQSGAVGPTRAPTTGDKEIEGASNPGLVWDPSAEVFVAWPGSGSTVYTLDPRTWVWKSYPAASGNEITPATSTNGTYGRFQYVPSKGIYIVATGIDQNVYAYRPAFSASANSSTTLPTVSVSATNSTLTWSTTGAASCAGIHFFTDGKTAGTVTIAPSTTTTYTVSCIGPGGTTTKSVTTSISAPPPPSASRARPTSIIAAMPMPGSTTQFNLSWVSLGATSCTGTNFSTEGKTFGSVSVSVDPGTFITYTVSCTGIGGTGASSTSVPTAPLVTLTAAGTTPPPATTFTINWAASGANSCNGTNFSTGGEMTGAVTVEPSTTTTYTVTCSGPGGTTTKSVTTAISAPPQGPPTLSLSAASATVANGSPALLNWSSANASSCTASGGWSGPQALLGSQSTGALTVPTTFTLTCSGQGGSTARSVMVSVTSDKPQLPMPSLQDEKSTYQKWGWSWTANQESTAVTEPIANYYIYSPDLHGDTEGDDLWSYLMMYRRTANVVYLNRAMAWLRYFKSDYRNNIGRDYETFGYDASFGLDHLYGWGLIDWYLHSGDTEALDEAERIGREVEKMYLPNTPFSCYTYGACLHYGARGAGRHLLLITRLSELNPKWIPLRDNILNYVVNAPEWDAARGTYWLGEGPTDEYLKSPGAYKGGARLQSPFMLGILAEGLYHAWRVTKRADVKARLVDMARFVDQYGLDDQTQYAGSYFGIVGEKKWHNYMDGPFWDTHYTISLVNTLVYGYKLSGDPKLLDRSKYFFNRGTKAVYGSPTARAAADNQVHHFVDTTWDPGGYNFGVNRGELQYSYRIFENGGNPSLE